MTYLQSTPHNICRNLRSLTITVGLLVAGTAYGSEPQKLSNLMDMSLTDLATMPVTVTSVSKRPETRRQAASAIYVINQEDIRRSAATSIPELLRMVPGLEVARIDGSRWAITSRGGNHEFANKLLVMIDGRSVYSPIFGGVHWDVQALPLRDIDRIEVIRGPGASLWGINAMNGVINIITRSAEKTQGGVVSAHLGSAERVATVRQGATIGDQAFLRVWAQGRDVDSLKREDGLADDDWTTSQVGFRVDSRRDGQRWEMDGRLYQGRLHNTSVLPQLTPPYTRLLNDEVKTGGVHLRLAWQRPLASDQTLSVQTYYDRSHRELDFYREVIHTLDVEIQHDWQLNDEQQWSWGVNVRHSWDELDTQNPLQFFDERGQSRLQSLFGQYTYSVGGGRGKWVLGSKVTHSSSSDLALQPSVRFAWNLNKEHLVWSSISRAVRSPSRFEQGTRYDAFAYPDPSGGPLPVLAVAEADGTFSDEKLTAYELGMRNQFSPSLALDTALFFNQYEELLALEAGEPFLETEPQPPHLVVPSRYTNYSDATSYGLESALDWTPAFDWRVAFSYSYLHTELQEDPAPGIFEFSYLSRYSPRHQLKLRSYYNFAPHWELDTLIYYTDDLGAMEVKGYARLDVRLGWNPLPQFQLSIGGKNLLEAHHREFDRTLVVVASEVERSFYVNAAYAF
ncbi:TonB-dependent receptor [uncultured Marinobacter sp.]|uniref:TonB-dependent receptor plug domain-containing protein n=1 Tax=uncultured Marinobacter sp. TaxID=187379 RepID=UPI00258A5CEC|nr:TonB-dependent receptor [uncultured Marinobacter sp.]